MRDRRREMVMYPRAKRNSEGGQAAEDAVEPDEEAELPLKRPPKRLPPKSWGSASAMTPGAHKTAPATRMGRSCIVVVRESDDKILKEWSEWKIKENKKLEPVLRKI